MKNRISIATFLLLLISQFVFAQDRPPQHGKKPGTMVITDAIVIDGVGTPPEGPMDIVIRDNRIESVTSSNPKADYRKDAKALIDAKGKYVLPGFINMHGHLIDERAGKP
ncbi:amidohydrolase, partial [bacterium]|nr:amidohydrolase [bacterium]